MSKPKYHVRIVIRRRMPWETFRIWRDHRRHIKMLRHLGAHPELATPEVIDNVIREQRSLLKRDGWNL